MVLRKRIRNMATNYLRSHGSSSYIHQRACAENYPTIHKTYKHFSPLAIGLKGYQHAGHEGGPRACKDQKDICSSSIESAVLPKLPHNSLHTLLDSKKQRR